MNFRQSLSSISIKELLCLLNKNPFENSNKHNGMNSEFVPHIYLWIDAIKSIYEIFFIVSSSVICLNKWRNKIQTSQSKMMYALWNNKSGKSTIKQFNEVEHKRNRVQRIEFSPVCHSHFPQLHRYISCCMHLLRFHLLFARILLFNFILFYFPHL